MESSQKASSSEISKLNEDLKNKERKLEELENGERGLKNFWSNLTEMNRKVGWLNLNEGPQYWQQMRNTEEYFLKESKTVSWICSTGWLLNCKNVPKIDQVYNFQYMLLNNSAAAPYDPQKTISTETKQLSVYVQLLVLLFLPEGRFSLCRMKESLR